LVGGRYRLTEPITTSGDNQVWRGRDTRSRRPVVIKRASNQETELGRLMIAREAIIAAAVSGGAHRHLVTSPVRKPTTDYVVLDLIPGQTLRDYLKDRPTGLPPDEVVEIGRQLCRALQRLHSLGLVHRDVKPANVMWNGRQLTLLDYGIATVTGELMPGLRQLAQASDVDLLDPLNDTCRLLGTVGYMPPEVILGYSSTPASDIFAVGCVLYELVTGQRCNPGHAMKAAYSTARMCPIAVAELKPEAPSGLVTVIERALAKAPADRFPTARAMRRALRRG
jgi:serine/threonine-protein kinase